MIYSISPPCSWLFLAPTDQPTNPMVSILLDCNVLSTGYLGFIGLFCLEAGLSMTTGLEIGGYKTWPLLFTSGIDVVFKLLPGVACGIGLLVVTRRFTHFAVLPCCLVLIPLCFFGVMAACGATLEDARAAGWVGPLANTTEPFWKVIYSCRARPPCMYESAAAPHASILTGAMLGLARPCPGLAGRFCSSRLIPLHAIVLSCMDLLLRVCSCRRRWSMPWGYGA